MMAFRSVVNSKIPKVIILGATGTGKTKLGIELAQRYETEIISADSMQIYKGLDVVTAKASPEEREMAPHHLLDILEPHQIFTVVDFRSRALKIIDSIAEKGKIPIIVGGTNYYVESIVYNILVENSDDPNNLLWDRSRRKRDYEGEPSNIESKRIALVSTDSKESDADKKEVPNQEGIQVTKESLQRDVNEESKFTNEEIHSKLKAIDPAMADRLHPNNRRKILRSIEVWLNTGRRHSEILAEQKQREGQLRWPDATIIFWLKCEQSVHDERLNARVDDMLKNGLIAELLDFHDRHNKQRLQDGRPPDYTKGIFQTLGFKEFHEYLLLPEEQRHSEDGQKLLLTSIENMKMATRRYARRQNKMILGRFLNHPDREVPPIYELDTTDLVKWDEEVRNKAVHTIESYINNTPCKFEPLQSSIKNDTKGMNRHSRNYCDICERVIIGDKEYAIHMGSTRHKKVLKSKMKSENTINQNE